MDGVVQTLLTNAGVAGALLIVLGWAYWQKDRSEKATQTALVKQAEKHAQEIQRLHGEFVEQLKVVSEKRTTDAQRVASELMLTAQNQTQALHDVAVTNTKVEAVLTEVRRDIRHRNRRRSTPDLDM